MAYHKYKDNNNQWRWRLIAANNKIVANSGEGYHNEADCDHAINIVKGSSKAPVHREQRGLYLQVPESLGGRPYGLPRLYAS